MQTPFALAASSALGALSIVCGTRVDVKRSKRTAGCDPITPAQVESDSTPDAPRPAPEPRAKPRPKPDDDLLAENVALREGPACVGAPERRYSRSRGHEAPHFSAVPSVHAPTVLRSRAVRRATRRPQRRSGIGFHPRRPGTTGEGPRPKADGALAPENDSLCEQSAALENGQEAAAHQ